MSDRTVTETSTSQHKTHRKETNIRLLRYSILQSQHALDSRATRIGFCLISTKTTGLQKISNEHKLRFMCLCQSCQNTRHEYSAMILRYVLLWNITQHVVVISYRRFGTTCRIPSSSVLDCLNLHHGWSLWSCNDLVSYTYTLLLVLPYCIRKLSASNHRLENSILLEVEPRQQREEILRAHTSLTRPKTLLHDSQLHMSCGVEKENECRAP